MVLQAFMSESLCASLWMLGLSILQCCLIHQGLLVPPNPISLLLISMATESGAYECHMGSAEGSQWPMLRPIRLLIPREHWRTWVIMGNHIWTQRQGPESTFLCVCVCKWVGMHTKKCPFFSNFFLSHVSGEVCKEEESFQTFRWQHLLRHNL